jgi:ABC-type phosphate transport system substrate-binding protein
MLKRLVAAGALAAAATTAMAVTPALADPPSGTTPAPANIVGVGSDTIQNVMDALGVKYDAGHTTKLYSWDATNPTTGAIGDPIVTKSGCASIPRPNGSSAGITALDTQNGTTGGHPCMDFARSSRDRSSSDPAYAAGGIAFTDLAGDAVTWAANSTTDAPATLTQAQLVSIYECTVTNWNQVGGKSATIKAFLPQTGSGTRAFFLTALGNGTAITPGSCVSDNGGTLEENEGVNPVLAGPQTIFPYSIGKYIAERYHSAKCLNSGCTPNSSGVVCTPTASQNQFGCNTRGSMNLKQIGGVAPTTGAGGSTVINSSFPATFQRTLYDVVKYSTTTTDHIPSNMESLFGASGWICTNSTAHTQLKHYGFLLHATCGLTH